MTNDLDTNMKYQSLKTRAVFKKVFLHIVTTTTAKTRQASRYMLLLPKKKQVEKQHLRASGILINKLSYYVECEI